MSKESKKIRGHIPGGVIKQIFDTDDPAEEAAKISGGTSAVASGLAGWSGRMQRRMRFGIRYFEALKDTLDYAHEAFGQVAEEAIVNGETDEIVDTDTPIRGLHPERETT